MVLTLLKITILKIIARDVRGAEGRREEASSHVSNITFPSEALLQRKFLL